MLKVGGLIVTGIFAAAGELTSTSESMSIGASPFSPVSNVSSMGGKSNDVAAAGNFSSCLVAAAGKFSFCLALSLVCSARIDRCRSSFPATSSRSLCSSEFHSELESSASCSSAPLFCSAWSLFNSSSHSCLESLIRVIWGGAPSAASRQFGVYSQ